jgi:hypothetical protein
MPASGVEPKGVSVDGVLVRFGALYVSNSKEQDITICADKLRSALEEDPRVQWVRGGIPEKHWDQQPQYYPFPPNSYESSLLGTDLVRSFTLSDEFTFKVHVPKKNQPKRYDVDDIPTEDYLAKWNGEVLAVFFEHAPTYDVAFSAGQVVGDILQEVTEQVGLGLYRQGCSLSCDDLFSHTSLAIIPSEHAVEGPIVIDEPKDAPPDMPLMEAYVPVSWDMQEIADTCFLELKVAIAYFYRMKNTAHRLLHVDHMMTHERSDLLELQYQRAKFPEARLSRKVQELWKLRSWSNKAQAAMARLWLQVSEIEDLKRTWSRERFEYRRDAAQFGRELLFLIDDDDDVSSIEEIDLSLTQSALDNAAGRLDARSISLITLVATLAGGIGGALVGRIG